MENKKEQILNKIREANPELMKLRKIMETYGFLELDFAVSCKLNSPEIYWKKLPETASEAIQRGQFENHIKFKIQEEICKLEKEILGKDPTLSDLLLTIGKTKNYATAIDTDGMFIVANDAFGFDRTGVIYDLTKSLIQNLENEELVDFIYSIICKEE